MDKYVPVVVIKELSETDKILTALKGAGINTAEITFRTDAAEEAIRLVHEELPEVLLGAGTVLTTEQADRAMDAGASFVVAPGYDPNVTAHVIAKGGLMASIKE